MYQGFAKQRYQGDPFIQAMRAGVTEKAVATKEPLIEDDTHRDDLLLRFAIVVQEIQTIIDRCTLLLAHVRKLEEEV